MAFIGYYGSLATTASVFVGILTAYLVTRLSDLKSQRGRLKQRVETIDARLRTLHERRSFRESQLIETNIRWDIENAEDEVDSFIDFDVGFGWDPSPNDIDRDDVIQAFMEHRDIQRKDLTQHHVDAIDERWDEIMSELAPTRFDTSIPPRATDPEMYVIDALWDIYEREKYDERDREYKGQEYEVNALQNERGYLTQENESLDPQQLYDSIRDILVPIALSVIFPLFIRFLHEMGWVLRTSPAVAAWEPIIVSVAWLGGFVSTLVFVYTRISGGEKLPDPPSENERTA